MRPYRWPCRPRCRRDTRQEQSQTLHHTVRPQEAGQRKAACDRPSIMTLFLLCCLFYVILFLLFYFLFFYLRRYITRYHHEENQYY